MLSALRLNFRLCVFTGAVAAVEYALVRLLYVKGVEPPLHVVKGVVLISLGVLTGLVAQQIKT